MKINRDLYFFTRIVISIGLLVTIGVAQEVSLDDSLSLDTTEVDLVESDTAKNPLKPPDTSSPRATLISFLDAMNRSYRLLMFAHRKNIGTPGLFSSDSVRYMAAQAEELFERGIYCLNLIQVPPTLKRLTGYEKALKLKEIFDRIELPPFDEIPDALAIEAEEEERRLQRLHRWQVPNTDIVIARVDEGPRSGEYLFSPQIISRLDEFYRKVKHLSYKSDVGVSKNFYTFYMNTPGRLLPPKWNQWLPVWSKYQVLSQTIWQWFALIIIFFLAFFFIKVAYRSIMSGTTLLSTENFMWRRIIFLLISVLILVFVSYIFEAQLSISGPVFDATRRILSPIFWLLAATMIFFLGRAIAETIIASPKIDPGGIQASYIRAIFGLIGFIIATSTFIYGLSRIGVSLIPLLTGLGIGGLAVALAARPTIENVIASFMIFWDNPYQVGQRIKVMGQDGTVEAIGLRSTKIRLLTGPLTSIPNERMAAVEIENIGRRPYIRRTFNITITYDTPPLKINRAVQILREILAVPEIEKDKIFPESVQRTGHPNEAINKPDFPPRVCFNELNADSLNILVNYWYHPPDYWDYLEHSHWVNLQIMERFNAEGIDFAFPTQTVHLTKGNKLHDDLNQGKNDVNKKRNSIQSKR